MVNHFRLDGKLISKDFANRKKPLEELYAKSLNYLRDLINKKKKSNNDNDREP